ncbi:ABC transporter ATP-binding protein [Rufibacter quisquiliarum]|uniref:ABC-2 type transport system ATP-binding protein n=1 Tax=Rufibacter quisquiliarum TaxID=1549639 RepID=A0A839GK90_9BACT|nr:ABC transporter ATP-binding protein [Rufibacter quisquiliarum]MBA9078183.1 ABC-2 type transport system ATP-binding protein [Rufibacter quisquiliarum]
MLTFQGFSKSYADAPVLEIQQLTVPPGIHWVKGRNGSGKTTLFKVLAGLLPYKGDLFLNGTVALSQQPVLHRQHISFGEAEPLYPSFITGQELVNLFAKARQAPHGQAAQLAKALGAEEFLHKATGTYSSGMQKKLSLVLAFLGTPRLILLDEPLITLDTATVQAMYALIKACHGQGVSFLLTSHQDIEMPDLPLTATWLVQNQMLTLVTNA